MILRVLWIEEKRRRHFKGKEGIRLSWSIALGERGLISSGRQ